MECFQKLVSGSPLLHFTTYSSQRCSLASIRLLTTNINHIFATTTRDSTDVSNPANWFNLCNLEAGVALGLTNVLLFIEESGSMTRETIDTALALFRAEAPMNGFNILPTVYNSNEDWVSPCLNTEL